MSKDAGDILGSVLALICFAGGMGWSWGFCDARKIFRDGRKPRWFERGGV
jgi:hypothetical protein